MVPSDVIAHSDQLTQTRLTETEQRMTAVLDELGLTGLVTSITELSAVGAAAILAETGDPRRFATARALVKHARLAPREKPYCRRRQNHLKTKWSAGCERH